MVSAISASASLFTPHCTSLTLDKSYSLRSCLRSEGVSLLACIMVWCWTAASWWPSCLHALCIYLLDNLACFRLVFRKFGAHFAWKGATKVLLPVLNIKLNSIQKLERLVTSKRQAIIGEAWSILQSVTACMLMIMHYGMIKAYRGRINWLLLNKPLQKWPVRMNLFRVNRKQM